MQVSYCVREGYAERGLSVQDGDTDLELRDLSVKVPCHEPLAQQFHVMHLLLEAAPAVVSAPSSPESQAEVFRCAQGLVSGTRARGDGLPWLGVLTGRDDRMSAAVSDGIVAFAPVVRRHLP